VFKPRDHIYFTKRMLNHGQCVNLRPWLAHTTNNTGKLSRFSVDVLCSRRGHTCPANVSRQFWLSLPFRFRVRSPCGNDERTDGHDMWCGLCGISWLLYNGPEPRPEIESTECACC